MKRNTTLAITMILTLAVIGAFAVGPMVNASQQTVAATRPNGPTPAMGPIFNQERPFMRDISQQYEDLMQNGKDVQITATITDIVYGNGQLPTEIKVKTNDNEELTVILGPIWMFNATELILNTNVTINGRLLNSTMVAFSITFSKGQLVQLRNYQGIPLWAQRGPRFNPNSIDKDQLRQRIENFLHNRTYNNRPLNPPLSGQPK